MTLSRLKRLFPWLFLGLIMAWPLLIVNKGIDLTDSGFYLGTYRYVFSHPEFTNISTILSSWLGGLIYALVPSGQLLAIKLAAVAIYAAIAYWTFAVLRGYFPDWLILLSLLLSSIFATTQFYCASYNTFSYLFLSSAIFFIYRGLKDELLAFLLVGAALLGLNVFNRLPNILQWGLMVAPLWYYWICLGERARALKDTLYFCFVMVAAFF